MAGPPGAGERGVLTIRAALVAAVAGSDATRAAAHPSDAYGGVVHLPKLMDERMGHEDGSVQARYTHITPEMRRRLLDGLAEGWEAALEARRAMHSRSPVAVLDELLMDDRTMRERPMSIPESCARRP